MCNLESSPELGQPFVLDRDASTTFVVTLVDAYARHRFLFHDLLDRQAVDKIHSLCSALGYAAPLQTVVASLDFQHSAFLTGIGLRAYEDLQQDAELWARNVWTAWVLREVSVAELGSVGLDSLKAYWPRLEKVTSSRVSLAIGA